MAATETQRGGQELALTEDEKAAIHGYRWGHEERPRMGADGDEGGCHTRLLTGT